MDSLRASVVPRPRRGLPRGLRESTLAAIVGALDASPRALSAGELGHEVGVARVTARRYLEYLELLGAVDILREPDGPGRPRNRYRRRKRSP